MSQRAFIPHYTYNDYFLWEGEWELIGGVPISMSPAPTKIHQALSGELYFALKQNMNSQECPECELLYEVDWKVTDETVLRPDIIFVCGDEHTKYISKAPQIVIEILSPSTALKDETVKFEIYEEERVGYYIMVYPNDLKAKVYHLKDDRYVKVGDFTKETLEFEGLKCELSLDFGRVFQGFKHQ